MPPRRPPLTHFVSIPLHTPTLDGALAALAARLPAHVPPAAVRPATTLHLTLGVMSLPTPTHLHAATSLLSTLDLPSLLHPTAPAPAPAPLTLSLRSLEAFGPCPPQQTSVLYAVPADATGRLQGFAERVRDRFVAAGLVARERRALRLHATVVNTVYAGGRGRGGARMTFDAAEVLEWGRGAVFAEEVRVRGVCICRMGEVWDRGVSGGYLEVGRRELVVEGEGEEEEEEGGVGLGV